MRILNLKNSNKKKVRGLKRKCKNMIEAIMNAVEFFPANDFHDECWHTHLPVAQTFIDSQSTPRSVRKLCIQTLITAGNKLLNMKPINSANIRVVILISYPNLWNSQIIVFFNEKYYCNFFDRKTDYQKWTLLPHYRSIQKELHLSVPKAFYIKGYLEEITDEDYYHNGELWFIGELD